MKPRFIQLLAWCVPVLLLAACAAPKSMVSRPVSSAPVDGGKPGSILFIGNSYSFEVPRELKRIAARNGQRLRVGQVTHGGWTLKQHSRNEETLQAIRGGGWDVVVLQEQSRIPSLPVKRLLAMYPAVRELAETARSHGAVPVLYQTWGYRDGDPHRAGGDDFHAMTARLREGYRSAAQHAGGARVIPVGDAWENEMAAGRGAVLFMEDGSHPTSDGNRLTASVFYEALFGAAGPNRTSASFSAASAATPVAAGSGTSDPSPASGAKPSADG